MKACQSADHFIDRRRFLRTAPVFVRGVAGLDAMASPSLAHQLQRTQKRALMIFLNGGMSQFESCLQAAQGDAA